MTGQITLTGLTMVCRGSRRVVLVDDSKEIAGDGQVKHSCIGDARRMLLPPGATKADIAREALENHSPQACCLID